MASSADLLEKAEDTKEEIKRALKADHTSLAALEQTMNRYRTTCETLIFQTDHLDHLQNFGRDLWNTHVQIKEHYHKLFKPFRQPNGKKRQVERRKLGEHYLRFVKSSQRFYRGLIQRCATHYWGIPEIDYVATSLRLDIPFKQLSGTSALLSDDGKQPLVQTLVRQNPDHIARIIHLCYDCLIYLGDLSRYRETEYPKAKTCNWAPAKSYYEQATLLLPSLSLSWKGLAAISNTAGDPFGVLYHTYRSLSVPYPFVGGNANLQALCERLNLSNEPTCQIGPDQPIFLSLVNYFPYLHASCHLDGADDGLDGLDKHAELEQLTMDMFNAALKQRQMEGIIRKVCLSNIAAEHIARERNGDSGRLDKATTLFGRLNIKTFTVLLQSLISDINGSFVGPARQLQDSSERLTPLIRQCLPHLRLYSSWLIEVIRKSDQDWYHTHRSGVNIFWTIYCHALNSLTKGLTISSLPKPEYLFKEDVDILYFTPFDGERNRGRYVKQDGTQKPHPPQQETARELEKETMSRIRDLVQDGICLSVLKSCPISFDGSKFEYGAVTRFQQPPPSSITTGPCVAGNTVLKPGSSYQNHSEIDGMFTEKEMEPHTEAKTQDILKDTTMHNSINDPASDDEDDDLMVAPLAEPASTTIPTSATASKNISTAVASTVHMPPSAHEPVRHSAQNSTAVNHFPYHDTTLYSTFPSIPSSMSLTPRTGTGDPAVSPSSTDLPQQDQQHQGADLHTQAISSSATRFQADIARQTHQLQAQSSLVRFPPDISSLADSSSSDGTPQPLVTMTMSGTTEMVNCDINTSQTLPGLPPEVFLDEDGEQLLSDTNSS